MPRSRLESAVVVAGIVALGLVAWLSVAAWHRYQDRRAAPEPVRSERPATTPVRTTASVASASSVHTGATNKLTLTAARGDSWVELRAGSSTGRQLYAGILAASRTISFPGRRFWLSLGAASNVDARFGGRPVRGLPGGVATVTIDGGKLTTVG